MIRILAVIALLWPATASAVDFDQGVRVEAILDGLRRNAERAPSSPSGVPEAEEPGPGIDSGAARAVAQRAALTFHRKEWGGSPRCEDLRYFSLASRPRKIDSLRDASGRPDGCVFHYDVRPYRWMRAQAAIEVRLRYSEAGELAGIEAEWAVLFREPPRRMTVGDLLCPEPSNIR